MAGLRAVIFDVDGVLIDSLPEHLAFCRDAARRLGLDIAIPTAEAFRERVRSGATVSPMSEFFRALGFPQSEIAAATNDYETRFMTAHRPRMFPGVPDMLARLGAANLTLGIVTSNTALNVLPALGDAIRFFDERCLFFLDRYSEPRSKSWCLKESVRVLNIKPTQCIYIGDQPGDAQAAREAGTSFLGVTYGWGISPADREYDTATTVSEIAESVLAARERPASKNATAIGIGASGIR